MYTYLPYLLFFLPGLLTAQLQGGSGDGSAFQRSAASSSLPIRLLSFTADSQESGTHLQWIIKDGTETDYFDVERSADGRQFTCINHLLGDGREEGNYAATDPSPLAQGTYYRLRVVDLDRSVTLSDVVYLPGTAAAGDFRLYPNPTRGTTASLYLTTPPRRGDNLIVTVYDSNGRQHYRTVRSAAADKPSTLSLPVLSPGSYVVQVSGSDGRQQSQRLTVSR